MDDLSSMTVVELKKELRSRSLKISGKKADLIVRLRAAIDEEESETETNNNNNNDSNDNTNDNTNTNSFADFEEYINDEYNRLNNKESHVDDTNNNQIDNIDELLNTNQNTKDDTDIKDEQEQKDIILNTNTPGDNNNDKPIILSDFNVSEDPNALNNKSKIEDRRNRFGTQNNNDLSKIESRKRRFNHNNNSNNNNIISTPPAKKPRVDMEAERNKVFERAQKYGTSLPKGFKLTADESKVMYADKIERAKRFGTQHLLPTQLKKAEENIKKEERKKRFKIDDDVNNNNNNNIAVKKTESKPVNIIGVKVDRNSTKLMERKLRFGNGIAVEDGNKSMNNNKKFNNRQFRNNEKFKQFRAYKKNNKNNRNNRGGGRGRGYGGNRRVRGRGGGYRNNNNNNNGYDNGVFSAEDLEKINQRKMRFNSL